MKIIQGGRGHLTKEGVRSGKWQRSKKKLQKSFDPVEIQTIDDNDDDNNNELTGDASKQLVLYKPDIAHKEQSTVEVPEPIDIYTSEYQSFVRPKHAIGSTVLPSIGAYTVQCAACFKWRVIPTKEKYEELRESICQELFVCARAHEWNRVLSCEDPEDISQDNTRVWAIDKPNISQPPPGWDREVRIRGEGSYKFADVYYTSPSGKKLRSLVEIGRYLEQNPDYIRQGVNLSQFSFASPKPLQENYTRKRNASSATREFPNLLMTEQVDPLSWAAPPTRRELFGALNASTPNPDDLDQPELFDPSAPRTKKRTVRLSSRKSRHSRPFVHAEIKMEDAHSTPSAL